MIKTFTHWIFDMDGTLTIPAHDFESIRRQLGIPAQTPILEWIANLPPQQAQQVNQRLHELEMELAYKAMPQPKVVELLSSLKAQQIQLGILTRNGKAMTTATLKAAGLLGFFQEEFVITRDCCAPKPNSEGVHRLLHKWQSNPDQTVIVGDYLYDIEAGFKAGIQTIHYDQEGRFPWPEYTHFKVSSIEQLWQAVVHNLTIPKE